MLNKTGIEKYFIAEKQESLVFLILGISVIMLALVFHFLMKTQFYKGASIPLLILGMVQAVAGYSVYVKSDDQRISQVYAYDMNPGQLKTTELSRMQKVRANFRIYKWIEIGVIIAGIIIILIFRNPIRSVFWLGFGISLTAMAAEYFIADFIAEKRAVNYTAQLEAFNNKS